MTDTDTQLCPCGSDRAYACCCGRFHHGDLAPTPEALMRSRYSAFVLQRGDYLLSTWHPDSRPASITFDTSQWCRLDVLAAQQDGDTGTVHFRAISVDQGQFHCLDEHSRFERIDQRWLYRDGDVSITPLRPERNQPCPCGSGKKYKACCR